MKFNVNMTQDQEAKRDLLREYFARQPGDEATLTKMRRAMERVGYTSTGIPSGISFGEAVDILYAKLEQGEEFDKVVDDVNRRTE
jgi:hypothetical protein